MATLPDPVRGRNRGFGAFPGSIWQINRPQCCCCTHQQALLCCCTTATALVWLPHTPVWLPHTPCVVSTQRQVCGCRSGAGPGGTLQSLEPRGYTHAPKIASPRCWGTTYYNLLQPTATSYNLLGALGPRGACHASPEGPRAPEGPAGPRGAHRRHPLGPRGVPWALGGRDSG